MQRVLSGLAAVSLSAALAAQQAPAPQPRFLTGVDVVQVDVSVLDKDRNPVSGLTSSDFTVRVDGQPVSMAAFTPVTIPPRVARRSSSAAWVDDVAPDFATNKVPREGRLVVILFDQTLKAAQQVPARRIATEAVEALGPDDMAAVVHVLGGTPQAFTSDRARLRKAIASPFIGLGDGEEWIASTPVSRSTPLSQSANTNSSARGQCAAGLCTLEAMTHIAESLRDAPRRKMLLVLGTGALIRSQAGRPVASEDRSGEIKNAREKLFRALDVANLTVHAIDPTGLETLVAGADRVSGARISPLERQAAVSANLARQGDLQTLPARTGGRTVMNANDPGQYLPAIFNESRSYYSLAFVPTNPKPDGRFHAIDVRVNRKDVSVYARRGYYAAGGAAPVAALSITGAPPALVDPLIGTWPRADLPMRVSVSAFAAPGEARPFASVVIGITRGADASADAARTSRPPRANQVDVLVAAFDRDGKSANYQRQTLQITSVSGAGLDYEVLSRLPLEPGRYQLRVAADDGSAALVGSVFTDVEVPDFAKAPLSLSGLVLSTNPPGVAAPATAFADLLPVVPTTRREFATSDRVTSFVRVYQGGRDALRPVAVRTSIEGSAGPPVFETREEIPAGQFGSTRAADCLRDLPIATLAAGEYLLTVEVTERSRTERRTARFTLR